MVRALLVDDEPDACRGLQLLLKACCPDVAVVDIVHTLPSAKESIQEHSPDLVFLDVELAHGTGFDLFRLVDDHNFLVIFVTAHSHYALKALKAQAVDLLVKPVESSDLIVAVERVKQRLAEMKPDLVEPERLEVPTRHGMRFIAYHEIEYVEADGNYSTVVLKNDKNVLVSRQLGSFEKALPSFDFLRIHKSHIINLNHLVVFERLDGGIVEMASGKRIEVSKKYKQALLDAIKKKSSRL